MPTSLASRVTRPHAGIISVFVVVVAAATAVIYIYIYIYIYMYIYICIYIEGELGGVGGKYSCVRVLKSSRLED